MNGLGMPSTRQGDMNKMPFTHFIKFAIMSLLRGPSRRSKRGFKYSQQELKGGSYCDITLMPVKHTALAVTNLTSYLLLLQKKFYLSSLLLFSVIVPVTVLQMLHLKSL